MLLVINRLIGHSLWTWIKDSMIRVLNPSSFYLD